MCFAPSQKQNSSSHLLVPNGILCSPFLVCTENYGTDSSCRDSVSRICLSCPRLNFVTQFLLRNMPDVSGSVTKLHICRLKLFRLTLLRRITNSRRRPFYYQYCCLLVVARPLVSEAWLYRCSMELCLHQLGFRQPHHPPSWAYY